MNAGFPVVTFADDLAIQPDCQLKAVTEISPAAGIRYARALHQELKAAMARCTIDDPATSPMDRFEQIHALKNTVSATGCQALLAACTALQIDAAGRQPSGGELKRTFHAIARAACTLIEGHLHSLPADY